MENGFELNAMTLESFERDLDRTHSMDTFRAKTLIVTVRSLMNDREELHKMKLRNVTLQSQVIELTEDLKQTRDLLGQVKQFARTIVEVGNTIKVILE